MVDMQCATAEIRRGKKERRKKKKQQEENMSYYIGWPQRKNKQKKDRNHRAKI